MKIHAIARERENSTVSKKKKEISYSFFVLYCRIPERLHTQNKDIPGQNYYTNTLGRAPDKKTSTGEKYAGISRTMTKTTTTRMRRRRRRRTNNVKKNRVSEREKERPIKLSSCMWAAIRRTYSSYIIND